MCMKVFEIHFLFEMTPLNKSFFLIEEMTKKLLSLRFGGIECYK